MVIVLSSLNRKEKGIDIIEKDKERKMQINVRKPDKVKVKIHNQILTNSKKLPSSVLPTSV